MNLNKTLRTIIIGLLFLIPIFALVVANSFFFPFITGKAFYFRILVELAFSGWVILAFLDPKYRLKLTGLNVAVTVVTLVALIADLLGGNPLRSIWSNFERMEGWLTIVHLWALFIVATCMFGSDALGKKMWHRFFNMSLAVAFIVGIYGLFQYFGWSAVHQGSSRLDASLGNSEYMAVYMLFHVFLAAYLFFVARAKKIANWEFLRWAYPVLAVFFSFLLFETQTRGAILGLLGGAMLALAIYAIFGKNEPARARWISGGIIVVIIALGFGVWAARNTAFIKASPVLDRLASISIKDTTTQARAYIWPMAIKGFEQKPLFGWGQENFNYIFNANYNPHMWAQEQWFDRAHDVFLDWLTSSGAVGLIAYLSLYVLFLMAVWKSDLTIAEKSALTGLLAAYAVHSVFVFDNLASYVLFFSVLGFGASLNEGKPIRWLGEQPFSLDAVEYIVAPVMIVVLAVGVYFLNIRPIEANTDLIAALQSCGNGAADPALFQKALAVGSYNANQEIREQLLACMPQVVTGQYPGPIQQAMFQLTSQQIQAQIAATPGDARIYAIAGSALNSVGQYAQAEPLLETAHKLSPGKQSISLDLALDYIQTNQNDKAIALLKQAYDSSPDDGQSQTAYVSALIVSGKDAEARALFPNDPGLFQTEQAAHAYTVGKQYDKAIAVYRILISQATSSVPLRAQLAQVQYTAGMISQAVQTLRDLEKDHPELKTQIDAAIQQIQTPKS